MPSCSAVAQRMRTGLGPYLGSGVFFRLPSSGLCAAAIAESMGAVNHGSGQGGQLGAGSVANCGAESGLGDVPTPSPVREVQRLVWGTVLSGHMYLLPWGATLACGLRVPPIRLGLCAQSCPGGLTLRVLRIRASWWGRWHVFLCGRDPQPGTACPCPGSQLLLNQQQLQCSFQPWVLYAHQGTRLLPCLGLSSLQALGQGAMGSYSRSQGAAVGALQVQRQVAIQKAEAIRLKGALQGLIGYG